MKCKDIIEGDKKGTFIQCKCKSCYIDETEHYWRVGGNPKEIEEIKEVKKVKYVNTTITLPQETKEKAREKGINLSGFLRAKLKEEYDI